MAAGTVFKLKDKQRVAVIDVGSNSTHLYVVDVLPDGSWYEILHLKKQLRLTEFTQTDGNLSSEAVAKISETLQEYRQQCELLKVTPRAVATFAVRNAANWIDVCKTVQKRSGVYLEVVSGLEEARLIHKGVLFSCAEDAQNSHLVVDIGGGSAEIVIGNKERVSFAASLKLGAARLYEKFLRGAPSFSDSDLKALQIYVLEQLAPICRKARLFSFEQAIVSGGTAKALYTLVAGGKPVGSQSLLSFHELNSIAQVLLRMRSLEERRLLPHMDPKRADMVVPASVVLLSLSQLLNVDAWRISQTGIREGIVLDNLERTEFWQTCSNEDFRWQSALQFLQTFGGSFEEEQHFVDVAMLLFDALQPIHQLSQPSWRALYRVAALLAHLGMNVNFSGFHKHSAYLIQHGKLLGFSMQEVALLGAIVRYQKKKPPTGKEDEFAPLDDEQTKKALKISSILRLAATLERTGFQTIVHLECKHMSENHWRLLVQCSQASCPFQEFLHPDKQTFEREFGVSLEIIQKTV